MTTKELKQMTQAQLEDLYEKATEENLIEFIKIEELDEVAALHNIEGQLVYFYTGIQNNTYAVSNIHQDVDGILEDQVWIK